MNECLLNVHVKTIYSIEKIKNSKGSNSNWINILIQLII